MTLLKKLIVLSAFSLTSWTTHAAEPSYQTQSIGGRFTVSDSETKTLNLNSPRFIRNIVVQAEGISRDSMVEVMVNGEVKGTIYAPGRDPSYIVTIGEAASSIQFRHRSGGSMRILDVTATLSSWVGRPDNRGSFRGSSSQVINLANRTIKAIDTLRPFTSIEDEHLYLMPIKRKAGQVLVMANARGDLSGKTNHALVALQMQIDFSSVYLESLMEREALFDMAVELHTIRETIADLLD